MGLALAAIGIYCVISYNVTQRVHEIGVRMAVGASRADSLNWVLGAAIKSTAIGLSIGLFGGISLERFFRFSVFGAAKFDATSIAAVMILLLGVVCSQHGFLHDEPRSSIP